VQYTPRRRDQPIGGRMQADHREHISRPIDGLLPERADAERHRQFKRKHRAGVAARACGAVAR